MIKPSPGPTASDNTGNLFLLKCKRALALLMASVLFAMMALVTTDVFGRYLFNTPVKGGFEIIQFLLAIVISCALPLITWDNSHITVSIFEEYFERHFTRVQQLFVLIFSTATLAMVTWRMWEQGNVLLDGKQVTGFLEWPIAPIAYFMSLLSGIAFLITLNLIGMTLLGKELPKSDPSPD